jgi:hypothetical protein
MATVVPVEGAILQRLVATLPPVAYGELSREALLKYEAAQAKTAWGRGRRRRFALVQDGAVLASAEQYDLVGTVDGQLVTMCGITTMLHSAAAAGEDGILVDELLEDASRRSVDLVLLFKDSTPLTAVPDGFAVLPMTDVELTVSESSRHGAPMTLVRGGEDRDLDAIAAMGHVRAGQFRFHLDRDASYIKHVITRKRLLAGLGPPGRRQLEFVIAEEGITAAAYIVITIVGDEWIIEECGDRDPSGARVGALLQALIAREPTESRPTIRGWLPPGFSPPQVTIAAASSPAPPLLLARPLSSRLQGLRLSDTDVLYWHSDFF